MEPMDRRYPDLVAAVERAINEADPIGLLAGGAPSDEYAPEIGTIIPLLTNAHRPDDVTGVLHGEFLRSFGEGTAGPRQANQAPTRQIWDAFTRISEQRLTGPWVRQPCGLRVEECLVQTVELFRRSLRASGRFA